VQTALLTRSPRETQGPRDSWWTVERLVLAALTVVAGAVFVLNDPGVVSPLTKPEVFLAPWQSAGRYAAVWTDSPNLGTSNFNIGLAPVAVVFGLLEAVGLPVWLAMRVWSLVILVIGAWGMRRLYVDLTRGTRADTAVARVAVAVAYAANPYVIVGGGSLPTGLPYYLLPWLVLWWRRGFRTPGWRPSVVAALVLTAMSGINVGVVPLIQLVVLLPLVAHARLVDHVPWRAVVGTVLRTGVLYAAMSLYWLVPSLLSLRVGTAITSTTESLQAINSSNSFAEVLRGLGMWTMYGRGAQGAFQPEYTSYVTVPLVVIASFGGLVLAGLGARLSRSPARLFAALSVLTGAVVMLGAYPYDDRTPWGRMVLAAFEHVPGLVAFRTTNKAGGVLELGIAVLVALGIGELAPRLRPFAVRGVALVAAATVVVLGTWPAWTGRLYEFSMPIPGYWQQAADALNDPVTRADQRAMMVPGIHLASYDWGYSAPDELGQSLLHPEHVVRTTIPNGSPYAANLTGAVDQRLLDGTAPAGTVSALAAYLGASQVLARYDITNLDADAGATVESALGDDDGLGAASAFGPATRGSDAAVKVRPVAGGGSVAALHPAAGAVVVDGDGAALPSMVQAGLLRDNPALLYTGSLSDEQLRQAVRDGARVVLTDTNQRREWSSLDQDRVGPLLDAGTTPPSTGALFEADQQTVALDTTGVTVSAHGQGLLFGPFEEGDPRLALDGDRTTVWRFGNFSTGVGNGMTIRLDTPKRLGGLNLQAAQDGGNAITSVRVTTNGPGGPTRTDVDLGPWPTFPTRVELPDEPVSEVTVDVTGVSGTGIGPVGFAELTVDDLDLSPTARTPAQAVTAMQAWTGEAAAALETAPIDLLFHRRSGGDGPRAVAEATLRRQFSMPVARDVEASGTVRLAQGAPDADLDALAGADPVVAARASSRAFHNPALRASQAIDRIDGRPDLRTAWVPNDPVVGEWIRFTFPRRSISGFDITQPDQGAHASKVLVSVDDGKPFEAALAPGTSRVDLPERTKVDRVSVLITEKQGEGLVQFQDVSLPHLRAADTDEDECRTLATVDGDPVRGRLAGSVDELFAGHRMAFTGCRGSVSLASGQHDLAPAGAFALDDLRLRGDGTAGTSATSATSDVTATEVQRDATSTSLTVKGDCDPCYLRVGAGFDDRWRASVGGRDLGPPMVVDGYSVGWRLTAADGARVVVDFAPTPWATAAWVVSGVAVLGALGYLLATRRRHGLPAARRRRRRDARAEAER
jgi:arabinofuranan 3-O-arabinosyltransferase